MQTAINRMQTPTRGRTHANHVEEVVFGAVVVEAGVVVVLGTHIDRRHIDSNLTKFGPS